jgi:predicted RNA-binding Zn-ribbon protein involved in translation (DUF1610 family)
MTVPATLSRRGIMGRREPRRIESMTESWSEYRLEWRCSCGLAWHSPIRSGNFRFGCPECGKAVVEIVAATTPGDYQVTPQPGAVATVVRLSEPTP